jgi:hypothetical protein
MGCLRKTHIAAFVALSLLILWTAGPGLTWAGPPATPRSASDSGTGGDQEKAAPTQTSQSTQDRRGFKGVAISVQDAGDDTGLRLKTEVLVKPLKTDQFFVSFAASAPLNNNKETLSPKAPAAPLAQDWNNGFSDQHSNPDQESASDWLVITNWPQSRRLFSMNHNENFRWAPKMGGPRGWSSKMELIFLPADQWTIRAMLSLAHDVPEYRQFLSSGDETSARIGMAIDVDYQIFNSIALGFDYGHWRYGRDFSAAAGSTEASSKESNSDQSLQSDSFSARLTIRF